MDAPPLQPVATSSRFGGLKSFRLAICFGSIAALETWFLSGVLPDQSFGAWAWLGAAATGAVAFLLGLWLGRLPHDTKGHTAVFLLSTLGAGALNGLVFGAAFGVAISSGRSTLTAAGGLAIYGSIFGVLVALCFYALPLGLVLRAHTQIGRARRGSVLDIADRRSVWFTTAAIAFVLSAIALAADPPSMVGPLPAALAALAVIVVLWATDLNRIIGFFRAVDGLSPSTEEATASNAAELDLGVGLERWVLTAQSQTAYRSRPRVVTAVRGSVFAAQRALTLSALAHTVVVVSSVLVVAYRFIDHSDWRHAERPIPFSPHVVTPQSQTAPRRLSFHPQPGPIVADVNGDGIEDVLGLSWDSSHEEAALDVIAIDGSSLGVLWTSEPVRSQWASPRIHLVKSGDSLFLTDSEGLLHVYDSRWGKQRIERPNPSANGPGSICGAPSGDSRIWIGTDYGRPGAPNGVIVQSDGTDRAAEKPDWCHTDAGIPSCEEAKDGAPCSTYRAPISTDPKAMSGYGLEENDLGVGIGPLKDGIRGSHLVGYDPSTRKVRWDESIAFTPDELHGDPHIQNTLRNGRLFSLYQQKDGHWQLGARDARTGEKLWSKEPPGSLRGTSVVSMTLSEKRLYLVVDWRVDVFDVKTGTPMGVIW